MGHELELPRTKNILNLRKKGDKLHLKLPLRDSLTELNRSNCEERFHEKANDDEVN